MFKSQQKALISITLNYFSLYVLGVDGSSVSGGKRLFSADRPLANGSRNTEIAEGFAEEMEK